MSTSAIKEKVKEYGLTEVWSSPDPQVDIVFVHGLNGNPYNTWATHKPEVYWPTDLLPSIIEDQHCRILTYGYDASVTAFTDGASKDHIHNHAEHLAARLVANRSVKARERPIIFVAHSLGGLVVKRLLIYCESINNPKLERLRSIYVSTFGILFLGTPHNGSDLAKWGSLLQSICHVVLPKKMLDSSPQLVDALKRNNEILQNINRLFIEIVDPLRIYFFHEAKPMDLKGTMQFVVDEDSAAPVMQGVERMGIEKDHSHMCKFEDATAPGFDVVADAISSYAEEAPSKVKGRWEREKKVREYHRQSIASELLGDSILNIGQQTQSSASPEQQSRRTSTESSVQSVKLIQSSASQSSHQPPRVAPLLFRPNSVFVGFDIEYERLQRKLRAEEKLHIGTLSVLICGPPGSGKSHLAREYVWNHQADYPAGIFWVDCKSRQNKIRYYWDIGQALGCLDSDKSSSFQTDDSFIEEVRKCLESLKGWLIVFDGVFFDSDEALTDFVKYVPDSPGNCIIYTSVDPTLKKRHRLLSPSSIKLLPLRTDAACELLLRSLGISKYTPLQRQKAVDLVRYYGCLPLGIHAAAHMLRAQGRALEKFSPAASDKRLVHPFLEILRALEIRGYTEAVTLLALLSLLNHKVPVALLNFGIHSLFEFKLDIQSPDRAGGVKKDLDSTIGILLRYGLVERELQTCSMSTPERAKLSPQISRTTTAANMSDSTPAITPLPTQLVEESTGLGVMLEEVDKNSSCCSTGSISITIDTLRTHTITQAVIREEMKANGVNHATYQEWLIVTCNFLCASYAAASIRLKSLPGQGSVADYREYKSHVSTLWKFLPRSHKDAPARLTDARNDLLNVFRDIQDEIRHRSPSQSQSSHEIRFKTLRSVFDNPTSSADEGPETPNSDITRASTWGSENVDTGPESSLRYHHSDQSNSQQVLADLEDDGYTTDYEELSSTLQSSQRWSVTSDTTTTQKRPTLSSPRRSFLHTMLPRNSAEDAKKDSSEFRPVATIGRISNPEIRPVRPRSTSSSFSGFSWPFRRTSSNVTAEAALAAVQAKTPVLESYQNESRKASSSSESRERVIFGTNSPPLAQRSGNTQIPVVDVQEDRQTLNARFKSPIDGFSQAVSVSKSPRLAQSVVVRQAAISSEGLPIEENITITRRYPAHSSLPLPTTQIETYDLAKTSLSGYASVPMSRDISQESRRSLFSAPAESVSISSSLTPTHLEPYAYQRKSLSSIEERLGHSLDLKDTQEWRAESVFSLEDDSAGELKNKKIMPATAPATAPASPDPAHRSGGKENSLGDTSSYGGSKGKMAS